MSSELVITRGMIISGAFSGLAFTLLNVLTFDLALSDPTWWLACIAFCFGWTFTIGKHIREGIDAKSEGQ